MRRLATRCALRLLWLQLWPARYSVLVLVLRMASGAKPRSWRPSHALFKEVCFVYIPRQKSLELQCAAAAGPGGAAARAAARDPGRVCRHARAAGAPLQGGGRRSSPLETPPYPKLPVTPGLGDHRKYRQQQAMICTMSGHAVDRRWLWVCAAGRLPAQQPCGGPAPRDVLPVRGGQPVQAHVCAQAAVAMAPLVPWLLFGTGIVIGCNIR